MLWPRWWRRSRPVPRNGLRGRLEGWGGFHGQSGYGGFSVSPGEVDSVVKYIEQQEVHHRATSFEEEYRRFLKAYEVEYDERFVWD